MKMKKFELTEDLLKGYVKTLPDASVSTVKGLDIVLDMVNSLSDDRENYKKDLLTFMKNDEKRYNFIMPPNPRDKSSKESFTAIVKLDKDSEDKFIMVNSENYLALEIYLSVKFNCGDVDIRVSKNEGKDPGSNLKDILRDLMDD